MQLRWVRALVLGSVLSHASLHSYRSHFHLHVQAQDACKTALAQTEDLINSISIPACASPQDSFPRPATPEITTYTRQSMLHRPSFELKPPILASLCQCGCQHRYIIAIAACDVYCIEAHLGCKLRLSRQQCDFTKS